jgi:hypothetical protein
MIPTPRYMNDDPAPAHTLCCSPVPARITYGWQSDIVQNRASRVMNLAGRTSEKKLPPSPPENQNAV